MDEQGVNKYNTFSVKVLDRQEPKNEQVAIK